MKLSPVKEYISFKIVPIESSSLIGISLKFALNSETRRVTNPFMYSSNVLYFFAGLHHVMKITLCLFKCSRYDESLEILSLSNRSLNLTFLE